MRIRGNILLILHFLLLILLGSCRGDVVVYPSENEQHGESVSGEFLGFYLLNEGNMGSNKSTLDYYDFSTATYTRNIYSERNPHVPLSLGDVGNDLKIYGGRMYAVVNVSNKIEVMTADSARRIGQIDIPNCRYLCFDGGYGYVTSYAGPVQIGKQHAQLGYVARFDTATLEILDTCIVGYQPDGVAAANGKLYVANSGGYMLPDYETEISVVRLSDFKEEKRIEVAPNLHYVMPDRYDRLWVSARGNYNSRPSRLYCIDLKTETVVDSVPMPVDNFCIEGDSLFFFGQQFNWETLEDERVFGIVNVKTRELLTENFINDDRVFQKPYGIAVNPMSGDIYLTDAKDYVTPGMLYCIGPEGKIKWEVRTGDIPAHFAFRKKTL